MENYEIDYEIYLNGISNELKVLSVLFGIEAIT